MRSTCIILVVAALAAAPAFAQNDAGVPEEKEPLAQNGERIAAAPRIFVVDPNASSVRIHVGKTGLGSFAGHEHEVVAPSIEGELAADFDELGRSWVELSVDATALRVVPEHESEGDAPEIERQMKSPHVLRTTRYPKVRFVSRSISGRRVASESYQLVVAGDLSLHGVVRRIVVPLEVASSGDALSATGKLVVKQTDFGIEPTSAAGGLVKVEDEVTVAFSIVARARGN